MPFKTLPPQQPSDIRLLEGVKPGKAFWTHLGKDCVSVLVLKEGKDSKVALIHTDVEEVDGKDIKVSKYSVKTISNYQLVCQFEGTLTCYAAIDNRSKCPKGLKDLDPTKLYALLTMVNDKKRVDAKYVFSPNATAAGKVTTMEGDEVSLPFGRGFFVCEVEAYVGGE